MGDRLERVAEVDAFHSVAFCATIANEQLIVFLGNSEGMINIFAAVYGELK